MLQACVWARFAQGNTGVSQQGETSALLAVINNAKTLKMYYHFCINQSERDQFSMIQYLPPVTTGQNFKPGNLLKEEKPLRIFHMLLLLILTTPLSAWCKLAAVFFLRRFYTFSFFHHSMFCICMCTHRDRDLTHQTLNVWNINNSLQHVSW